MQGPEIIQDFAGKRLDYWVTGYGTGGTLQVGPIAPSWALLVDLSAQ